MQTMDERRERAMQDAAAYRAARGYDERGERPFVAVAYEGGKAYDYVWSWETGQSMSNEGYEVIAIADDGHMSIDDAQALYGYERALVADCFGEGYLR